MMCMCMHMCVMLQFVSNHQKSKGTKNDAASSMEDEDSVSMSPLATLVSTGQPSNDHMLKRFQPTPALVGFTDLFVFWGIR